MPVTDEADDGHLEGRRFHLIEVVGAGAFGEVYLAEQESGPGFRRKVAIKLLHGELQGMRDAGRRMRDEARILGRLSHPNIVTVLDLVKLSDQWAVIMDYVPGADLEQLIDALLAAEERMPPAAALEIGAAVCSALDAAFTSDDGAGGSLGVIHRDIKPSNVRITKHGDVKVLDFGVARVDMDTREAQTRKTGWIGTERYMSPERILCSGDGPAGDVYAAAATLVELLLRRPLGRTPVLDEPHTAFVEEALDEVCQILGGGAAAEDVVDLLGEALATEPDGRPDAGILARQLEQLSRTVEGEHLAAFCRRFLPEVDRLLGREAQPASGVLSVGRSSSGPTLMVEPGGPPTTQVGEASTFDTTSISAAPPEEQADSRRRGGALLLAVAGALAGLTGVALVGAAVAVSLSSSPAPTPPVTPVEAAVVAPAPVPAPVEPERAPVDPEPAVVAVEAPAPAPVLPAARPAPRPAPTPAPAASTGPRVKKALFVATDAASLEVRCGDVAASGTASARITNFPAGICAVDVVYLGASHSTEVRVERPREVRCRVDGALVCE